MSDLWNESERIRTVALIGLGAVGAVYLDKIAETVAMGDIRVIAGGERGDALRRDGVVVNGRALRFPVYGPEDSPSPADLVLVVVKNHHLEEAVGAIRNHVGPKTVILSLLNGVTSEEVFAEVYGKEKVLYSLVMGTDATREANCVFCTTLGHIQFGEKSNPPGAYSSNVRRVEEFFMRAGVPYLIPEDMTRNLWKKFVLNVGVNQVTAALHATYRVLQTSPHARALAVAAMEEAVAVARKNGVDVTHEDIRAALDAMQRLSPDGKTSMVQDVEAGRQTEVECFGGTVTALGERYGISTPVNRTLVQLIHAIEES